MRAFILFTFIIFSLSIHLAWGGIFRRYVRKHRPGHRIPGGNHHMMLSRSMGPRLVERQFRIRQRPWPMYVRRARAPPLYPLYYPFQLPFLFQPMQPMRSRAARRYRLHDRLEGNRVPQFHHHHQPMTARHPHPIGIGASIPSTAAAQWRPLDFGNPIDRDPTYDYAPPAIERVRFVSEVRGGGRHPTARANTGMLGMYSRPSPVVVPAPWKRDPNVRARHPGLIPHQMNPNFPLPQPPRGAHPIWKILAHKQRLRRPLRPGVLRPHPVPQRFIGQDPKHPLYHHQVYQQQVDEAEVFQNIPNIVYFQPTDVKKPSYAKKNPVTSSPTAKPVVRGNLKPGSVSNVQLYSQEVSSSSEFRPVIPTRPASGYKSQPGNKAYQFTVVGYQGPAATTPMSPVASAPLAVSTTPRPPTMLYAVKTTPETLSTTHNSVVKPLEPTESLEPEEEAASELRPVRIHPEFVDVQNNAHEVVDGREQGGVDVDFDNVEEPEDNVQEQQQPVVPNSFNVFDALLSSFEKEFGGDSTKEDEEAAEDEILEVKEVTDKQPSNSHSYSHPVFEPAEDSTLRNAAHDHDQELTTSAPKRNSFETSTSMSVSVGVSSSSSQKNQNHKIVAHRHEDEVDEDDTDGYFANIRTVPTTTTSKPTTTTTTTTTTERPVPTTPEILETSTSTTTEKPSTSTLYPRLPTMPTYKRKPTPVYKSKISKAGGLLTKYSSSSSSASKEVTATGGAVPNGSGEVVIITAGRSKVKEYKPQVIANQTHLLSFDKVVAPGSDGESLGKETPIRLSLPDASPTSTSTTKSPLEDFDAMQLLHSWLNKA